MENIWTTEVKSPSWIRIFKKGAHDHRFDEEIYGDLREDEPGGPRIYHEVYWRCSCGKLNTKGCNPEFVKTLETK